MDYSTSELQQMTIDQEKQIEDNQRLISQREQRLKYLHIPKMEHRKYLFIQTLLQQINGNRGSLDRRGFPLFDLFVFFRK